MKTNNHAFNAKFSTNNLVLTQRYKKRFNWQNKFENGVFYTEWAQQPKQPKKLRSGDIK